MQWSAHCTRWTSTALPRGRVSRGAHHPLSAPHRQEEPVGIATCFIGFFSTFVAQLWSEHPRPHVVEKDHQRKGIALVTAASRRGGGAPTRLLQAHPGGAGEQPDRPGPVRKPRLRRPPVRAGRRAAESSEDAVDAEPATESTAPPLAPARAVPGGRACDGSSASPPADIQQIASWRRPSRSSASAPVEPVRRRIGLAGARARPERRPRPDRTPELDAAARFDAAATRKRSAPCQSPSTACCSGSTASAGRRRCERDVAEQGAGQGKAWIALRAALGVIASPLVVPQGQAALAASA